MAERQIAVELKTSVVSQNVNSTRKPHLIILVGGGAFLAVDFPLIDQGMFKAKGFLLKKAPKVEDYKNFISHEIKNEEILEVIFPQSAVKRVVNLLYKAK